MILFKTTPRAHDDPIFYAEKCRDRNQAIRILLCRDGVFSSLPGAAVEVLIRR